MPEEHITLTFPDGTQKKFPKNSTGYDVANSISPGLARNALSITLGDEILDLSRPIYRDDSITINTYTIMIFNIINPNNIPWLIHNNS